MLDASGLSLGIDVIEIGRIKRLFGKFGDKAKKRLFTETEKLYCEGKRGGEFACFAGKLAAKEAFLKALGTGLAQGIRWRDVEVLNKENGVPYIELHGRAKDFCRSGEVILSISHTKTVAVAACIIVGRGKDH